MDNFDIIYKNKVIGKINSALVETLNISDLTLEKIKLKHGVKKFFVDWLTDLNIKDNPGTAKTLQNVITNIEFELQDLWGFSRDIRYHKFWELPQCQCPKLDNEDRYPFGHYFINESCPLHGDV